MNLVTQMANKIIAKGLNHRQFCALLDEVESEYSDLLLHKSPAAVQWSTETLCRLYRTHEDFQAKGTTTLSWKT